MHIIYDCIMGERFAKLAEMIYVPKEHQNDCNVFDNTFCICALKECNLVYTHTMYVKQLFATIKDLHCRFVIVSHNCDENVDETFVVPKNVVCWFTQNVTINHPKIKSIPIGLENERWFRALGKKELMYSKLKEKRVYKNLAYLNCNVNTFPSERVSVYDYFENKPWVTVERGINGKHFEEYLDNVYNHKYVICPRGNGVDTHRLWETLYMGSIPVVRKDVNNWFYNELPILYVNEWEEVTDELLNGMWSVFEDDRPIRDLKMLKMVYWKNKILSYVCN